MSKYEYEETSNEEFDLKHMSNILDAETYSFWVYMQQKSEIILASEFPIFTHFQIGPFDS